MSIQISFFLGFQLILDILLQVAFFYILYKSYTKFYILYKYQFIFLRHILACSALRSTLTDVSPSTPGLWWKSSGGREGRRCPLTCSLLLTMLTLTCYRTGRTSPCSSRKYCYIIMSLYGSVITKGGSLVLQRI